MTKKIAFSGAAALLLVIAGYFIFFRGPSRKYEFRFDKASKGDLTAFVTATGTINPVISVDVGTQVSGIVAKLYADFNSVVKQGQVIAQIDPTFLEQSVKDAEASLDKAKAQYADSKRNLDREKALLERGLDSQLNYDASLTTYESNAATLKSAQASLDRAKINLAYATIYAPVSGVVINRAVNVGQTVAASFSSPTLYTIANDLSKMQVLTTVDESDIGRISIGQQASFSVDAYPDETFNGTISQIRLNPVTIQNVVNYTVVIDVKNDQLKLMPGMTANVKILVASSQSVLRVPNLALRFQPPADVIDTTRVNALREAFASSAGVRGNATPSGGVMVNDPDPSAPGSGRAQGEGANGGRQLFQALRDSIKSAHGGEITQEDLRNEMQKAIAARGTGNRKPAVVIAPRRVTSTKGPQYGIDVRFPEYQKSEYVPLHQAGRARVWILNAKGKLEPVFVRTGVTDGKFTEVTGAGLKEGDQIVMGVTSSADAAGDQTRNPLAGGAQQRPGGGGGGFR
jgi:HlyD family secretion protein